MNGGTVRIISSKFHFALISHSWNVGEVSNVYIFHSSFDRKKQHVEKIAIKLSISFSWFMLRSLLLCNVRLWVCTADEQEIVLEQKLHERTPHFLSNLTSEYANDQIIFELFEFIFHCSRVIPRKNPLSKLIASGHPYAVVYSRILQNSIPLHRYLHLFHENHIFDFEYPFHSLRS